MRLAVLVALLVLAPSALHAQGTILYSTDFDTPNDNCTLCYGMTKYPIDTNLFDLTDQPTGGWGGSGAVLVTVKSGQEQFNYGWNTPALSGWTPSQGDSIYIRFRMKYANGQPASTIPYRAKFLIFGSNSASSRMITYLGSIESSLGMLATGTSGYGGGFQTFHLPSDYGVTLSGDTWTAGYMGLTTGLNVNGPASTSVPPIMMAAPNMADLGTPGYTSTGDWGTYPGAEAVSGWYHVQIEVKSGTAGNAYVKQWANNNTYAQPNSSQDPLKDFGAVNDIEITTTGWTGQVCVGCYADIDPNADVSYILDDLEFSTAFDASWYPGGGGQTVPDPPTIGTATAGNTQCSVAFTPPGDDGGSTITGYTATSSPGSFTGTAASSPITVTGLSNGTGYTFTVIATNAEGNSSASSASNSCTPSAGSGPVRLRIRGEN